jgi:hypothetical protein
MKWTPRTERCYAPDGTLIHEKIQYVPDGEWHDISKEKQRMINARKLQYYTMAHRLRGFAEGVEEDRKYEALVGMLNKAAALLEEAWDEYQATLPPEQQIGS